VARSRIDSQPPADSSGELDTGRPSVADLEARENVWLSTGDLARVCGTTVRTVRFYEESGLLAPLTRSDGGHRMYRGDAPERLQLVMDLREAGLSLQEVRDLFDLKAGASEPKVAAAEMRAALHAKIATVNEKIAVLRRLRDELGAMVGVLDECARCTSAEFPRACAGCDVMKSEDLPRAMRLLWRGPAH
jgi:DNA-binding transcriptional MerR regulator